MCENGLCHTLRKLPADREEFNDDDSQVALPPHVEFVPQLSPTWGLWEDWVMQTWFQYCERIVRPSVSSHSTYVINLQRRCGYIAIRHSRGYFLYCRV